MNKLPQLTFVSLLFLSGCTSIPPNLGVNNGQLTPCPKTPNCVSSLSIDKAQYVAPINHSGSTLEIKSDILKVLNQLPNAKTTVIENNYIRAEFTSQIFRFVDDVEFYFPETDSNESSIYLRSASRVGYSDFGANRKRAELISTKFKSLNSEK